MGRHRRTTPVGAYDPADHHRFGEDAVPSESGGRRGKGAHRRRSGGPVRTGLLGASAAMAVGAVAVTSGLIPGTGDSYRIGGSEGPSDRVRADGPSDLATRGSHSPSASPSDRGTHAARQSERSASPSTTAPSRTAEKPTRDTPSSPETSRTPSSSGSGSSGGGTAGGGNGDGGGNDRTTSPEPSSSGGSSDTETAAEAQVVELVNQERAQAGCSPLTVDPELAEFAGDYSEDMAERGFFSHTTPDGLSPWDRAAKAGIENLAAENIARGQADAQAVMDSWMSSPGHRANILNCDLRTLGVGAHFAEGGPWWTQNFGR